MNTFGRLLFVVALALLPVLTSAVPAQADPGISPDEVTVLLFPGGSAEVNKVVGTPAFPPKLDVCLLEDETGSFYDDINHLQGGTTAADIYNEIVAVAPDSRFGVHGFRDYPIAPYGSEGDWVHRKLSAMSSNQADWVNGISALTAGGGNDTPEAQYDAIVAAVQGEDACEWREDSDVTRVLVVATDAPFHTPDGTHIHNSGSTTSVLNNNSVRLIGLNRTGDLG